MRLALLLAASGILVAGDLSGRRAPGFSLPDLDLTQHDLADYRGRVVLLEVMKTDCPTCGETARLMEQMRARFGQKIAVLAVVVPPDNQTTVRAFSMRNNLSYPVLFDCGQVVSSYLKATPMRPRIQLPHLFLIDRDGQIREDWGERDAVRPPEELARAIDQLLR